ncbi:MAG: hypothetical protein PF448_08800 [Bacteroidales bacterium]|jgi:hypothetical protein|nr:hypothetical protein [Bacteroidales bacterium]
MDKKNYIFIGIAVVLIAVVYLRFLNNTGSSSNNQPSNDQPDNNQTCTNPTTWVTTSFPLQLGVANNYVKLLQLNLNDNFNAGLNPDKKFGCNTQAALMQYTGKSKIRSALELYIIIDS